MYTRFTQAKATPQRGHNSVHRIQQPARGAILAMSSPLGCHTSSQLTSTWGCEPDPVRNL